MNIREIYADLTKDDDDPISRWPTPDEWGQAVKTIIWLTVMLVGAVTCVVAAQAGDDLSSACCAGIAGIAAWNAW